MDFSKALKSNPEKTVYPPLWNGPAREETPEPELVDDGDHPLLAEESPAYSASVIQRSFITWSHLGKTNGFRQTCDYYHRLEKLEETFTEQARLESRRLEFSIINKPPPVTSEFLANYGHIYGHQASQGWCDPKGIWSANGSPAQLIANGSTGPKTTYAGYAGASSRAVPNFTAGTSAASKYGYKGVVGSSDVKTTQAVVNGYAGHVMPNGGVDVKTTPSIGYSGYVGQMVPNNATYSKVSHIGYNQMVGQATHNGPIASAQVAYPGQGLAWLQVPRGSNS